MIIFIILPFWDYYFHIITLMGALLGPGPGPWALLGRARTMGPMGLGPGPWALWAGPGPWALWAGPGPWALWAHGPGPWAGDVCGGR